MIRVDEMVRAVEVARVLEVVRVVAVVRVVEVVRVVVGVKVVKVVEVKYNLAFRRYAIKRNRDCSDFPQFYVHVKSVQPITI